MLKSNKLFQLTQIYTLFFVFMLCPGGLKTQVHPFQKRTTYELKIEKAGVYALSYDWLSQNTSWDLSSIDLRYIQLWHGIYPMTQAPLKVMGNDDSVLDPGEQLLFFAQGGPQQLPDYLMNPYDTYGYYYLVIGNEQGLRVNIPTDTIYDTSISSSTQYVIYEEEKYNPLQISTLNSGSGQLWVGPEVSRTIPYSLPSVDEAKVARGSNTTVEVEAIVRSDLSETIILQNGSAQSSVRTRPTELGDPEDKFADDILLRLKNVPPASSTINWQRRSPNSKMWIDKVKITYPDNHSFDGSTRLLRVATSDQNKNWQITNTTQQIATVWILDTYGTIKEYQLNPGSQQIPVGETVGIIIFSQQVMAPDQITELTPIELVDMMDAELIIVHPTEFSDAAQKLKKHRETNDGLTVATITIDDCYRIFGAGQHGPEAIRNMSEYYWQNNKSFKYLLLMGDASYDYRGLTTSHPYQNLVPTFETRESLDPILSFPTDDYFTLLDEDDPETLRGDLDIAVGRLTVKTPQEADNVVRKLIEYDSDNATDKQWKNKLLFLADDEDYNLHLHDADNIATQVLQRQPLFNQTKVYWDAYQQISTPGGNRYPDATEAIDRAISEGALVVNYLGHGGPRGWAQERVLKIEDIESWSNFRQLPLIVTATCSFTGFDDPTITSAGEAALLNPVGGAVALYSTVRSVYASKNFRLTQAVFERLFELDDSGRPLTIGEVLRLAKNSIPSDFTNGRKFALIGDPSMRLHYMARRIQTTHINDQKVSSDRQDTIKALSELNIKGYIQKNKSGSVDSTYQGSIDVVIYDKPTTIRTRANDRTSPPTTFDIRNNILYKGTHPVIDGLFSISTTIPADINYIGEGSLKISYIASAQTSTEDVSGYYDNIYVDGSELTSTDDAPPTIEAYINSTDFKDGDMIPTNSTLIAHIADNTGINLSRAAIGHELAVTITGKSDRQTYLLDDYYTPNPGSNNSGQISFLIPDLLPGSYKLQLTVYDIANNHASQTLNFVISERNTPEIKTISITPMPISPGQSTDLIMTHTLPDGPVEIDIEMYDLTGQLINRSTQSSFSQNQKTTVLDWLNFSRNATDMPSGIYLCGFKMRSTRIDQPTVSKFERLTILK